MTSKLLGHNENHYISNLCNSFTNKICDDINNLSKILKK